jgi:predicted small lipoprotein YifL
MKKQIATLAAIAALVTLAACGSTPTDSNAAAPGEWQANSTPPDTTGRVPNLFGSGN